MAYDFERITLWLLGPRFLGRTSLWQKYVGERGVQVMVDRKRKGLETQNTLESHTANGLLPPRRPCLITFPEPSKIALQLGNSIWAYRGTFHMPGISDLTISPISYVTFLLESVHLYAHIKIIQFFFKKNSSYIFNVIFKKLPDLVLNSFPLF